MWVSWNSSPSSSAGRILLLSYWISFLQDWAHPWNVVADGLMKIFKLNYKKRPQQINYCSKENSIQRIIPPEVETTTKPLKIISIGIKEKDLWMVDPKSRKWPSLRLETMFSSLILIDNQVGWNISSGPMVIRLSPLDQGMSWLKLETKSQIRKPWKARVVCDHSGPPREYPVLGCILCRKDYWTFVYGEESKQAEVSSMLDWIRARRRFDAGLFSVQRPCGTRRIL